MNKLYITSDKVGEFVTRLYANGYKVSVDPASQEICVTTENGYEWVKIFGKQSFEDLCNAFNPTKEA